MLQWIDLGSVKVLYEVLKPDDYFRNSAYPELNTYGLYMYLEKDLAKVRYIGQAFGNSLMPLKRRIRWEIVKDGVGCAESAFCKKFQNKADRFELVLKVAHLRNPRRDEINVKVDDKFMNAIERALIFQSAQVGDPLMNETGKSSYKLEPIKIVNCGDFAPLPAIIDSREWKK
jgi:hypothetical protein